MDTATSRNAPCPCGSGKRYKHCHGVAAGGGDPPALLAQALAEQRAGRLEAAESLYRRALEETPDHADALHMLAVVRLTRGAAREALPLMVRALDATGWRVDAMRSNLGLVLAALGGPRAPAARPARPPQGQRVAGEASPLVSVVMPSFNHGRFVERALASVRAQDYGNLELVVVDDGSTDDSIAIIERVLRDMLFPARLYARENRGAHAALNDGLAQARGTYVQFLNSDDMLAPARVSRMAGAAGAAGAAWGFSGIAVVDADDRPIARTPGSRTDALLRALDDVEREQTIGLSLVADNVAVSSGNIFVERALADAIGGFRDYRYNHDWDFCLRALERSEPVFVRDPLYVYRLHGANTIVESSERARRESHEPVSAYLARATSGAALGNPLAPSGDALLSIVFARGMAALLDVGVLQEAARQAATR
jgi:glycosyltransferase involved in cell wall biosynthesis